MAKNQDYIYTYRFIVIIGTDSNAYFMVSIIPY